MKQRKRLLDKVLAALLSLALVLTGVVPQGMAHVQAAETEDELMLYYDFVLQNSYATEIPDASGHNRVANIKRRGGSSPEGNYKINDVNIYGKPAKAIEFYGGEDGNYLQLPNNIFKDCTAVTVSAWVNLSTNNGYQRIWDFGSDTTKYFYLLSDGGNTGFVGYASGITTSGWQYEKGVSKYVDNNTESNIAKNRWVLTTVVMDGSNMTLYENGEKIKDTVDTGITLADLGETTSNLIACSQADWDVPTKGQFAEIKIYNKALTDEQIKAMYNVDDAGIVAADKADLDIGDTSAVVADIKLPAKGVNGSDITWTSQNSAIEIKNGVAKVTRPSADKENAEGTLTAAIKMNDAQDTRTFDVTVLAEYTDQRRVDSDAESLKKSMPDMSAVMEDIALPATGVLESKITWTTTNAAITIEDGVARVTRPAAGNKDAVGKLTATLSYGETAKATAEFDVTVLAFREAVSVDTVADINVTTLKGHSPSLPNNVKATFTDGSVNKVKVKWPTSIAANKYAAAGTFDVEGTVVGEKKGTKDITVTAHVTVVDEEEVAKTVVSDNFDLSDISLDKIGTNGSILTQNRDRDIAYLKLLDNKRMLYNFYSTFGQTEKIQGVSPLGGWDEPTGLLRGHSTGHYMSALALAYGSTGDDTIKAKLDEMIHELRELQKLSKGQAKDFKTAGLKVSGWSKDPNVWGEGFVSAYSPDQFALLEQGAPYGAPDSGIWAPYYTLHKLLAGFLDAYKYTGNAEALEAAKGVGSWACNRLSALTKEKLSSMWATYIAGEFGGFNESLAQLYIYTGDQTYLDGAKLFDNTDFFNGLAANVDTIQGMHANQHIPQIVGAIKMYEASVKAGSPEVKYYDVAENFWQMVVSRYAYSIGGVGTGEKFTKPYQQAAHISGSENCETCAAYNMMKLTMMLNNYDPDDAEYMDYYERTLYNQILASQTPNVTGSMHNGTTYMLPIGPGSTRGYGDDYNSFSCCHGTGMENHVKYQEAAYVKTGKELYVGLYLPTTLTWEEKGVKVVQETTFPSEDTKLTVSALEGETAQNFDMKLRVPYWATNGFHVTVNGTEQDVKAEASSYVTLKDVKAGDVIEINMPWTLHLDKTPDKIDTSEVGSVMYGPFVMAAKDRSKEWITLKLNADLESSIQTGVNTANGFPTLRTNGLEFAPMFAPEYATNAYHAYFKIFTVADDGNYFDVKLENYTPEKGSIVVDEVVKEGTDLLITAEPKRGYKVQLLVVNGRKVQVGEDNTYTVQNVRDDVSIIVSFGSANPATPDPAHLEYTASVTSDYTSDWENLEGIKNSKWEPTKSNDGTGKGWGNWSQDAGSEHYVQYMWDSEVTMNRFDIFWYDDNGGTRVPGSMKIQYIAEDGTWKDANMLVKFADILKLNQYNTILFDNITTIAVRLKLTVRNGAAANGIYRWKVSRVATDEDKAPLKNAIDNAKKLDASVYTEAGQRELSAAITKANSVYEDANASVEDVAAAVTELQETIKNLPKRTATDAERKPLKDAIEAAKALEKDAYTTASQADLAAAITKAEGVLADKEAVKADIDQAVTDLDKVTSGLTKRATAAEKAALKDAIDNAKNLDASVYTEAGQRDLSAAITKANSVYEEPDVVAEDVAEAIEELEETIRNLPKTVAATDAERKPLKDAIEAAKALEKDAYTTASQADLAAAITKAEGVLADKEAVKADIDQAVTDLDKVTSGLTKRATADEKAALEDAIEAASAKVESKYTAKSWADLAEALKKANEVYENADSVKEDVDTAAEELNAAVNALEEKTVVVTKPKAPTSVKASWTGTTNIKVTWNKVSGADKYMVYRSYKKSSGYKKITTTTKTSYTDKKSTEGKTAYYKVIAVKGKQNSDYSKVTSAYKLKTPTKVSVKAKKRKLTISYGKVTNASGYEIYTATKKNGKYKKAATITNGKTTKKVINVKKKGTYYYKVRAYAGKKKIYTSFSKPVSKKVK